MRRLLQPVLPVILGLALSCTVIPGLVVAQMETGSLGGTAVDESGGVLPGVTITVENLVTGQTRTTVTNSLGRYQVAALQPSRYSVTAELQGFATLVREAVTVNVGSILDINFEMKLAGVEETVTVRGEAPLVETAKTEVSYVIATEHLEVLPSKNRNYLEYALLTPMTVENVSTTNQGAGMNLGGARAKETSLLVDGFYNMDEGFGLPRQRHSQDSIQEFQVVSFGGSAEHGRAIGGIVNAVTRSGGNNFAGTVYGFFRMTALNEMDPGQKARGDEKTEFDRQNFGGTLGGPIKTDKTFFFAAYDRVSEDFPFDNGITEENAALIGLPDEDVGSVPRYYRLNFTMGKLDHNINDNQRLQFGFAMSRWTEFNIQSPTKFGARSNQQRLAATDWSITGKWIGIYGDGNMLHELKVSYFPRFYETAGPNEGGPPLCGAGCVNNGIYDANTPPRVTITGAAYFGQSAFASYMDTYPVQALYSASIFTDRHAFKFGGDYHFSYLKLDYISQTQGRYQFNSMADFLAGNYRYYTQGFGDTENNRRHQYISAFVQDSWTVNDRLTMNYGLRYDLEIHPKHPGTGERLGEDYKAIGPRFALSYDMSGQGTTIIKLSTGIYVDRLYQRLSTPYPSVKGYEQIQNTTWYPTTPGAPTYPETFAEKPANIQSGVINAWLMPTELKTPRSAQVVGTVEHKLSSDLAITGRVAYSRSWNKEYRWDDNLMFDEAQQEWTRPDPTYRQLRIYRFGGKAEFLAGIFEVTRRGERFGFSGNLTLSRAYDTSNSGDNYPNDQLLGVDDDWGPVVDTPVVRGVVSGWYNITPTTQFSGIFRARTGMAVGAIASGVDVNGDGRFGDRTPTIGRNTFRAPGTNALDLRFTWAPTIGDTRLSFYVESFNTLNNENVRTVYNNYGVDPDNPNDRWMESLTWFPAREIQLGIRWTY